MKTTLFLVVIFFLTSLTQGQRFFGRRPSRNFGGRQRQGGNRRGNFGGGRGNRLQTGSAGGCLGPFCGQNSFGVDSRRGGITGNTCFNGDCTQVNLLGGSDGRGGPADQGCSGARCNQINIGGGGANQGCQGARCNQVNIGGGPLGGFLRPGGQQSSNQGCVGSQCRQVNFGLGQLLGRK